jgi:xylulokinase
MLGFIRYSISNEQIEHIEMAYLTFDLGTTALKCALIDDAGQLRASHTEEYTFDSPQPGWAEMPPERYWQAAIAGTRAVQAEAGQIWEEIHAIGFSSQGQTFVPVDRDGKALHPVIVWLDVRAQGVADEWAADWLSREEFHLQTGYGWIPGLLSVFQIGWLAQHRPKAHQAYKFLCLPDYLIYRMTGETTTDYVTARMNGLYDMRTKAWSPAMMGAAGISIEQLPTILAPGAVAGQLSPEAAQELGLPNNIPVCVGANDQLVGAIGAGNVEVGIISETTGTALALIATTKKLLHHPDIVVGQHAMPDKSYAMTFANVSAIVLTWLRDLCAPGCDFATFLAGVENIPIGSEGLCVLPHFAGTSSHPEARGAILGLSLGHTRAHFARAIMEACACLLQECLEPLQTQAVPMNLVRSLGGAARSDLWLQMKADLLGLPVERPACASAGSLGAAMLAAVGIGQFPDLPAAVQAWYRPERVFTPEPAHYDAYRGVYARYKQYSEKLYS